MSIIQQIREKYAAVGFGFIALSLIAFILMDAGKRGSGGGVKESDAIGEVNGVNISYGDFNTRVSDVEKRYAAQGQPVDDNMRQQISAEIWNGMINAEVMSQEFTKLGLSVGDKEFNDMLFGSNPPQDFKQAFTDPKTGVYDAALARQQISQQKKTTGAQREQLEQYLQSLIDNKKSEKYNVLLTSSVYVPKWMAEKTNTDNNVIASFNYVSVPYATVADSTVKISDAQIDEYVKAHASQFKQEGNSRSIAYTSFSFAPSATDTAEALKTVEGLKTEFKNSTDAAAFLARNTSNLPYYDGYNSLAKIQIAQKDSIVAAGLGNVYGPYLDGNNFVLSKIVDVKSIPDSAKCRHLLVKIADQNGQVRDDSAAHKKIDSLKALVDAGADFNSLVLSSSDDEGSKTTQGEYTFNFDNFNGISKEFAEVLFYGKPGDKKIIKVQNQQYVGYHYIEVLQQYAPETRYKIAYMAKEVTPSQETINGAQDQANIFYSKSKDLKAFNDNAIKENLNKLIAPDINENDFQIMGLGVNRKLVKDIFAKDAGEVMEPEQLDNQFVVVAITGEGKAGLFSAAKARPQVENILRMKEKAKILKTKLGTITTLEALAQSQATSVQRADSVSFSMPTIPNLGMENVPVGYAFNKAGLNKVSPVLPGTSGVFVIKADAIGARVGVSSVDEIQANLTNQQKRTVTYTSAQALHEAAKVKDNRSKFF